MSRKALTDRIRFTVLERYGFRCAYCGVASAVQPLEVDHIIPVAEGGTDALANLAPACQPCNAGKADKLLVIAPESMTRLRLSGHPPTISYPHRQWDQEEALGAIMARFVDRYDI